MQDGSNGAGSQRAARHVTLCGEEVREPGHICAFFHSRREKYATIAPYFRDAIQAGDRVINIVDAADRDAHVAALEAAQVPVDHALRTDMLRLMTTETTYVKNGEVDLEGVLDMLRETLHSARTERRWIRTCGEMSWVGRNPNAAARVMEYEARVNEFVPGFNSTLLCVYDVAELPAAIISDILATHPVAIINGRMRANPYFVEPDDYLEMLRARA